MGWGERESKSESVKVRVRVRVRMRVRVRVSIASTRWNQSVRALPKFISVLSQYKISTKSVLSIITVLTLF